VTVVLLIGAVTLTGLLGVVTAWAGINLAVGVRRGVRRGLHPDQSWDCVEGNHNVCGGSCSCHCHL
jgi:hypothetical protein